MCKINCQGGCPDCAPEDHEFVFIVYELEYGHEYVRSIHHSEYDAKRIQGRYGASRVDKFPIEVINAHRFVE